MIGVARQKGILEKMQCENNKRRSLPKGETTFSLCPRLVSPKLIGEIRNTAAKRENDKKKEL